MPSLLPTATAVAALLATLTLSITPSAAHAQTSAAEAQVNALEGLAGAQPGSRRSGAKGVCAAGHFVGNAVGRNLSRASAFSGET